MESKRLVALVWLIFIAAFSWGVLSQRYHFFPYEIYNQHFSYAESFPEDVSSLWQKIENDRNTKPWRLIRNYVPADPSLYHEAPVNGLRPRRAMPRIFLDDPTPAFRLLIGAFDFADAFWGALLIDETGKVIHTWKLSGEIPELNRALDINKGIYGVGVFPDGSIVFNLDVVNRGLVARDYCSNLAWVREGYYHHTASPSGDYSSLWTFSGFAEDAYPVFVELDASTGEIRRTIDTRDIQKKNPDLFIFDMRYLDKLDFIRGEYDTNYPHHNDIEPLPSSMADAFPQFTAGDVAINFRTLNLMYVMDPDTLKVKFWYFGAQDGGHDIDWQPDGTFSLLNNKWRAQWDETMERYSTVVSIDPRTSTHKTIWDGKPYNVYTSINGHHQITPGNTVLITSSMQGRFIETDLQTGKVVFEFINDYDRRHHETLHVSEAFYLPKDFFNFDVYNPAKCSLAAQP